MCQSDFKLVWIQLNWNIGLNLIDFQSICTKQDSKRFSDLFGNCFESHLEQVGWKSIQPNPIQFETSIWIDLNQAFYLISSQASIWINPNEYLNLINLRRQSDFKLVWIQLNWNIGLNLIDFQSICIEHDSKCFSNLFGMFWNILTIDSEIVRKLFRISSIWVSTNEYFNLINLRRQYNFELF